ncbi:hypothetical protein N7470_009414 [Penicillium chermesinum]|nr:hypothetical protein N7470_009414 [Penicillium chermesinum]
MGSVLLRHAQPDQIDSKMLGLESEYSRQLDSRSRSTSSNTPTSTSAPPPVGSTRQPTHNDASAYINSHPSTHGLRCSDPIQPASMPSSNYTNYTYPADRPSYSNSQTPQYSSGHHADAMMAVPAYAQPSPESPRLQPTLPSMTPLGGSASESPTPIRVQSLSHIQSLASEEFLAQSHRPHAPHGTQHRQFEISSMPVTDIIEMVAGLLTKITTTNDRHHDVLAFHGKNVPSITILSYLTRIHKYCPTTYEVFLSLLVYFDRMTDLVNRGKLDHLQRQHASSSHHHSRASSGTPVETPARQSNTSSISISPAIYPQGDEEDLSQFFVVDSFNIHRLVIAGVTCASKFFSDVFYTNSRYAKVGGLPLVELNHLELQFLLLNDFRLAIPVEELEAYGTMLVEFYAREVVAQQQTSIPRAISDPDAMYMRSRDKRQEPSQTPTPP